MQRWMRPPSCGPLTLALAPDHGGEGRHNAI